MKLRNPVVIKWMGFLASILIRIWVSTLSFRFRALNGQPFDWDLHTHSIFVFWHENILVPCGEFGHRGVSVLISHHADGELIAQVCKHVGIGTIRGSSTRGGFRALRELIRAGKNRHLALMPDGPRGPRRRLDPGLIYLASKSGMPIILVGIGCDRPWRLNTWDRFVLPRPFSNAVFIALDPVEIPRDADRHSMEVFRTQIETALTKVTDYAERLASRAG